MPALRSPDASEDSTSTEAPEQVVPLEDTITCEQGEIPVYLVLLLEPPGRTGDGGAAAEDTTPYVPAAGGHQRGLMLPKS